MKNRWGQDIEIGTVVYRGARDGNTSTYKIGIVTGLKADKRKVSVDWRLSTDTWHERHTGTPSIDTVAVIDPATLSTEYREALGQ